MYISQSIQVIVKFTPLTDHLQQLRYTATRSLKTMGIMFLINCLCLPVYLFLHSFVYLYHYHYLFSPYRRRHGIFTVTLFHGMSLPTDGSTSAQPPKSLLVGYVSHLIPPFLQFSGENAIKINAIIVIDIAILLTTILSAIIQ